MPVPSKSLEVLGNLLKKEKTANTITFNANTMYLLCEYY